MTHFARLISSGTDWESGQYNSKLICEVELKFNERFREKGIHIFCKRVQRDGERDWRLRCTREGEGKDQHGT